MEGRMTDLKFSLGMWLHILTMLMIAYTAYLNWDTSRLLRRTQQLNMESHYLLNEAEEFLR